MRLIDADKLRKKLLMMECMEDVVEVIDSQPTAYSIDKLVEELKKASYEIMLEGAIIGSKVSIIDLDEAIRIVRRTKVGE